MMRSEGDISAGSLARESSRHWLNCLKAQKQRNKEKALVAKLPKAAEYVVSELLAIVDIEQNFKGWAHNHRKDFQYSGHDFRNLAEALDVLRDAIRLSR